MLHTPPICERWIQNVVENGRGMLQGTAPKLSLRDWWNHENAPENRFMVEIRAAYIPNASHMQLLFYKPLSELYYLLKCGLGGIVWLRTEFD
jgi:hypothetical protein